MLATTGTDRIQRRKAQRFDMRHRHYGGAQYPGKDLVARKQLIAKESGLGHCTEFTEEELLFLGRS